MVYTSGAWVETPVHSFANTDGSYPYYPPVGGQTAYSTTYQGGTHGSGTVFKLTLVNSQFQLTTLYNFCSASNCSDGNEPLGGVGLFPGPLLYGTTVVGGAHSLGTLYKVTPSTGAETVVYSFSGGADGAYPYSGLTASNPTGTLYYGTTNEGGIADTGTVFEFSPSSGVVTVLYAFKGGSDGAFPVGGVVSDSSGNLYGLTTAGGVYGHGTVFKVTPAGAETILYRFTGGADGSAPQGLPVWDAATGNIYGTTTGGGGGYGTIFQLNTSGTLAVLHSFCVLSGCSDGATPSGTLFESGAVLYGTAQSGGAYGKGVAYQLIR